MFKCEKILPCGHSCLSLCHEGDCPPCSILIQKDCKCKKLILPVKCSINSVSCGKICGKPLPCSHLCTDKCHTGPCGTEQVSHLCKKKRENCEHTCLNNCHFPEPCPSNPCTVKVNKSCSCSSRSLSKICSDAQIIECNDECLIIKRDKALRADKEQIKEIYSEELVEFASSNLDFVKKVEEKLASIIKTKAKTTFMPPMKDKQRWLCHELASNHYKLDSESLDKEPYRSVYVNLTVEARVPTPLLSEFVSLVSSGVEVEFEKKEILASLLFYQLSASVTSEDLTDVLHKFSGDFFIKWENDHSAYAHFFSIHQCTEAEKTCKASPGQFSIVKMTVNTPQEDTSGFKKRFRNSKKPKEVLEFEEEDVKFETASDSFAKSLNKAESIIQGKNTSNNKRKNTNEGSEDKKKSYFLQFGED
jgi:hypothetical protein